MMTNPDTEKDRLPALSTSKVFSLEENLSIGYPGVTSFFGMLGIVR